MENNMIYTEEQLMARLKFFIGICLALTLTGIVFVVLYSLIFVTQPLNAISPIDQKFFELIVPIATFLTGTLSGIMLAGGDKDAQKQALQAANKGWDRPPTPPSAPSSGMSGGFGGGTGGFGSPAASTGGFGSAPLGGNTMSSAGGFGAPAATGFGAAPAAGFGAVQPGFGGKMAPPDAPQPLI